MFWGQALIEFRRTNKARSWPNFRAWHLKTDSKIAFATSFGGSRSPPLTTSFGISAFDMSMGTHPPTLPMSSRMHHFPNRPPDHRIAHTYQSFHLRAPSQFGAFCSSVSPHSVPGGNGLQRRSKRPNPNTHQDPELFTSAVGLVLWPRNLCDAGVSRCRRNCYWHIPENTTV